MPTIQSTAFLEKGRGGDAFDMSTSSLRTAKDHVGIDGFLRARDVIEGATRHATRAQGREERGRATPGGPHFICEKGAYCN